MTQRELGEFESVNSPNNRRKGNVPGEMGELRARGRVWMGGRLARTDG